jgi:hypothetical protein
MQDNYNEDFMNQAFMNSQQQGEQQDPNSLYADYMREEKTRNVIEQINPDNLLEDIEHRIRGEKKNRLTKEWESISKKQLPISELLISNYVSFLGAFLNQNTSLSNFSAQEINNLMFVVIDYLRDDLSDNAEMYNFVRFDKYGNEITDYNEMSRIGNIIAMSTFAVLKRAQNGMESRRIFAGLKMNESISPPQQKKSMMDALKFWN